MPDVDLESHGEFAIVRLNRPPVNALNRSLVEALLGALDQLSNSDLDAPFVFTATGDCFCAGLDLREIPTYSRNQQREFVQLCNQLAGRLYCWRAPVVGAINGHAMAAGFVLALTPDYRIAADGSTSFGLPEIKAGIPFPGVPLQILNAELPAAVVRRMTITARKGSIKDAKHDGVIDEIVPAEALEIRALEVMNELRSLPSLSFARIKNQIRGDACKRIDAVLARGDDPVLEEWLSDETPGAAAEALRG